MRKHADRITRRQRMKRAAAQEETGRRGSERDDHVSDRVIRPPVLSICHREEPIGDAAISPCCRLPCPVGGNAHIVPLGQMPPVGFRRATDGRLCAAPEDCKYLQTSDDREENGLPRADALAMTPPDAFRRGRCPHRPARSDASSAPWAADHRSPLPAQSVGRP